jgi:WD40 repeat protein
MAWSPDGQTIASASRDGTIRFWEARSGNLLLRIKGHTASVNSVAWSPNGQILATEMTCSVCDATISLLDREERIAPSVAAKSSEVVAKMDQEADESRNHAPSHKWLG